LQTGTKERCNLMNADERFDLRRLRPAHGQTELNGVRRGRILLASTADAVPAHRTMGQP
jgi:hypothetical protein